MLRAALAFFLMAILAIVLGANGIAGLSLKIGQLFLVVFLVLSVLSFVGSVLTGKSPKTLP
jgi:uncharacterized membrane protein YtjA (UPF0391 family)